MIKNERGLATFEAVPMLMIFVIFIFYVLGAFGIVHTGILHNIAARTYAFETFRHRAQVIYFRENLLADTKLEHYLGPQSRGQRRHAIKNEFTQSREYVVATERPISMLDSIGPEEVGRNEQTHAQSTALIEPGERAPASSGVNPAWIKVQYGICVNALCGAE